MRHNDTVRLNKQPRTIPDPTDAIVEAAADQRVLNVGAGGNAQSYLKDGSDEWLHAKIHKVAGFLVGLDIDADGIAAAGQMGIPIQMGNCETVQLDEQFDRIVLSDVLEHLDNPAKALQNLFQHLSPDGKILITTPNATFMGNVINAVLHRDLNVYWDHVQLYTPENIQALCDRHGWVLEDCAFFSLMDRRTTKVRMKSVLVRAVCKMFPRFHSAFYCVLRKA